MQEGNARRKTESTDANDTSSRSHAVLEVVVCRSDKNHYQKQVSDAVRVTLLQHHGPFVESIDLI